jgi:transposase-like protein
MDYPLHSGGMNKICPNPSCTFPKTFIRDGSFRRKEDSKTVQRFRCTSCGLRFSNATFSETYRQKKRRVNYSLLKLLSSGVSMRRSALLLGINKKTVERKLPFLARRCRSLNQRELNKLKGRVFNVQLDDLITKENSKLKPLSVTVAVDEDRRKILALEVSQIPAFGHLARAAVNKYGHRKDQHFEGLTRLFKSITPIVSEEVLIKSDEHQRYPGFIFGYLPRAKHLAFKSERGCVAGQGELKKIQYDPLFLINHTCALLRANVNRLVRKTWCTTKDPNRLKDHLDIFMFFYNEVLLKDQ